jgi:hypothetical protein
MNDDEMEDFENWFGRWFERNWEQLDQQSLDKMKSIAREAWQASEDAFRLTHWKPQ